MPDERTVEHATTVRYFHRAETKELWAVPQSPEIVERRETKTKSRRNPKRLGWTAYAQVEHVRADNWIRPDTHQWHYPHTIHYRESYADNYTLDEVRSYFTGRYRSEPGDEITSDEYERLKVKYEQEARGNKVPVPLPPRAHR